MTPVAHAMERGAKKSSAFLLQHGMSANLNGSFLRTLTLVDSRTNIFTFSALGQGKAEDFLYDVDLDGSSLLHLAVNSGVLAVSMP